MTKLITIATSFILQVSIYADIFGLDNRSLVPTFNSIEQSRSIAVGVINSLWEEKENESSQLNFDRLDYMCTDERFYNQASIAYACTGFLVGPDLLVTAGHCATNYREIFNSTENYCESYTWMFDYQVDPSGSFSNNLVSDEKIYFCKEIIYAVSDEGYPHRDFALIRLDRKVSNRMPLKIARENVKKGESVWMLGHPMGLPLTLTNEAFVLKEKSSRNNNETLIENYFLTDLDALAGNSGSPVFNELGEVQGVLVGGNPNDTSVFDEQNRCERVNRCDQNGQNCLSGPSDSSGLYFTGSEVQKLLPYLALIRREAL